MSDMSDTSDLSEIREIRDNPAASRTLPKPIKGAGLTSAGVVVLQFLLILLAETLEYSLGKVGAITGISLIIAVAGGIYLGRPGTSFAAAVNPPIALFISTIILIATIGGAGLHAAKFGLDLVTSLGAAAPYLAIATVGGWGWYLFHHLQAKRMKAKEEPVESTEL